MICERVMPVTRDALSHLCRQAHPRQSSIPTI
jgi:hypothetical protein